MIVTQEKMMDLLEDLHSSAMVRPSEHFLLQKKEIFIISREEHAISLFIERNSSKFFRMIKTSVHVALSFKRQVLS